jgi:hypothetical protein
MTPVVVSACKAKGYLPTTSPRSLRSAAAQRGYGVESYGCPPRPFAGPPAHNCRCSPNGWFAVVQHWHCLPCLPVGSEARPHSQTCMYVGHTSHDGESTHPLRIRFVNQRNNFCSNLEKKYLVRCVPNYELLTLLQEEIIIVHYSPSYKSSETISRVDQQYLNISGIDSS